MARPRSDVERRRRAFIHALGGGRTVIEAADHAGIAWRTLYSWRQKAAGFRAAWDRAAQFARDAIHDRMQAALIQRAVEGVDEPVFHGGERIGTRKRYSDALLLAGLRDLAAEPPAAPPPQPAQRPDKRKRVTVVIAPFGDSPEDEELPKPPPRPSIAAEPAPAASPPPDPAEERALDWSHLGRNDEVEGRR